MIVLIRLRSTDQLIDRMFDLLSPTDASTVLPTTRQRQRRYACCYDPTDHLTRQYLPQIFFLAFVLTTQLTLLTPGGPRGGDI